MSQSKHSRRASLRDASLVIQKILRRATGSREPPANRGFVEKENVSQTEAQRWLDSLGPREPGYDARLMPQLIDRVAHKYPDRVILSYPETQNPDDGFRDVTYRQFAHAVDRNAAWLEEKIGKGTTGHVIGFLAGSKASSLVLAMGAAKVGCTVLYLSPRNSLEGQLSLLDKLECRYLVTPEIQLPQTDQIRDARPSIEHLILPEMAALLDGPVPQPRPFRGNFDELKSKPLLWIHSSGTTSLPKPVPWTHGACEGVSYEFRTIYPEGEGNMSFIRRMSSRFFVGFPLFHGAGLIYPLCVAPSTCTEMVLPPEGVPMNTSICNQMFTSVKAPLGVFLPPAVIEDNAKDAVCYQNMIKQSVITTAGAALSREIGDRIVNSGIDIVNIVAASEFGLLPLIKPSEWYAIHFANVPGYDLEDLGDGRFELVLRRVKETARIQSCFQNQPHLDIYRTNDLYQHHPDPKKSHLWVVAGRSDDVVVLSNGEKFTPSALEEAIGASVLVRTALVFGMQREQAALLVEPRDPDVYQTQQSQTDFLEKLWPEIERANSKIAAHGRIMKTHVMLLRPEKQFLRTPKGSIMRRKMYALYAPEMDQLYAEHEDARSDGTAVSDHSEVEPSMGKLKMQICRIAGVDSNVLKLDDNIFDLGFDSLHGTQLVRHLKATENRSIEPTLIYNNPTVRRLHNALYETSTSQHQRSEDHGWEATSIAAAVEQLSKSLPIKSSNLPAKVVLMTGTSGGLGQHLLHVARQTSSHVYVLIRRPVSADERNINGVTYLHADLAAPQLGLFNEIWIQLLHTVTHIVHNAWLVDFNHPLPYFTSNLLGVRGLIDFASVARNNPRIWFASSIGAVAGLDLGGKSVEERIIPLQARSENTAIAGMGYAQSKRAAELLLAKASETSGVRSTICRIGQIAGSSSPGQTDIDGKAMSSWQARDYIPTLLKSARYLKAVPGDFGSMGRLDWTPIDHIAKISFELLEAGDEPNAPETQVFHLVNPATPPAWSEMLPVVRKRLAGEDADPESIEVVSLREFTARLEKSAEGASREDIEKNPGIKLLDFFKTSAERPDAVPLLDTTQAQMSSATLRNEPAMNVKWMDAWMKEWVA